MASGIVMLVVLVSSNLAFAQRGGRGGGSGRFGSLRQVMQNAEDKEVLDLLKHSPIRKKIGLSEEKYDEIRALERTAMRRIFEELDNVEECVSIIRKFGEEAFEQLDEEQTETLEGLFVQTRKLASAANARIAKKIDLSDEELDAFRDHVRRLIFNEQLKRKLRTIMDSNIPFKEKGDKSRQVWEEHFDSVNEELKTHLTEQQQQALKDLEGQPFDNLPRIPPGGGRGGRGQGGPGHGQGGPGHSKGGPPDEKRDQPPHGSPGNPTCDVCGQACVMSTL
ncbi:MAG: hypothetical protein AAGG44_07930 [Planctomycetota bacterium]